MVDVPEPVPGDGDALVRVRAATINPIDLTIAGGRVVYQRGSKP